MSTNNNSNTTNQNSGSPPDPKPTTNRWNKAFASNAFGEFAIEAMDGANIVRKWNGSHWELVSDEDGCTIALNWMHKNFKQGTKSLAASFWSTTASLYRHSKKVPECLMSGVLVPMKNCYLTVEYDGQITTAPPSKKMGMRFSIPVNFKGAVGVPHKPQDVPEHSLFGKYLATSIPDLETRHLIQEMCAMTLVDNRQHVVLWNYGQGMNGKGVLTELICHAHENVCTLNLHSLSDPHALEGIPKASLLVTDECEKGKWKEGIFKAIASGDPIQINPKGKSAYSHNNTSCWIINTNPPPFFTDLSDGIRRRIIPVPWPAQMTSNSKVENLAKLIIATEYHLVMDWLLQGLVRLSKRGFKQMPVDEYPEAVKDAIKQMSYRGDSLADWIQSNGVECVPEHWTCKEEVYNHYLAHCEDVNSDPLKVNSFWRALPHKAGMGMVTTQKKKFVAGRRVRAVQICLSAASSAQAKAQNKVVDLLPDVPIDDMRYSKTLSIDGPQVLTG